jgi:hypothetical protein
MGLNAAMTAPQPCGAMQASLPQPAPSVMTICVKLTGPRRKNAD